MSNLDSFELECGHTNEYREKYDSIINDVKKKLTLCNTCVDEFKNFSVIKFLSEKLERSQ